ncbi:MAG: isochorismatase family protein [Candidatus Hodarchaeales archaeon]|jgi:nicotinamidase-related amidase
MVIKSTWDNSALFIIDVQYGLFIRKDPMYMEEELLKNLKTLIEKGNSLNIPVIFIQHSNNSSLKQGTKEWQFHPMIKQLDKNLVIQKRHANSFKETELDIELNARNIKVLVIAGTLTQQCVKSTCIGAKELGYKIILVKDGHSTFGKTNYAKETIEKWNQELKTKGIVTLKMTNEIF